MGDPKSVARIRWELLSPDAPRDEYFEALHDVLAEHYLADPGNPYQQSGRGSGAERWEESRRCVADAVHRSGHFMDIGCANGLLLETVMVWVQERGLTIQPHGIDFIAGLVELAKERLPRHAGSFEVANVYYWEPRRRYDFVRVSIEDVPRADREAFTRRLLDRTVAPGGRLIVCNYWSEAEPRIDVPGLLEGMGFRVSARSEIPGVSLGCVDRAI